MPKHYVYRIDHDTGFAPHAAYGRCLLCGCKKTTIEIWAEPESWIVGIGGNKTGKAKDKLVYAMKVQETPSLAELRSGSRRLTSYLRGRRIRPTSPVLVSRNFYYFGDRAPRLPRTLDHLVIRKQGCKRLSERDVRELVRFLEKRFKPGIHGHPNNLPRGQSIICGCRQPDPASEPAHARASHRCGRQ